MSKGKWTAGPWRVCCGMVETADNNGPDCGNEHNAIPIARMDRETSFTRPVVRDANARLIAEAPAMAEIIRLVIPLLAEYVEYGESMRALGRGFTGTDADGFDASYAISDARAILARINGEV